MAMSVWESYSVRLVGPHHGNVCLGVLQCQIGRTTPWQCLSVSLTMSDWSDHTMAMSAWEPYSVRLVGSHHGNVCLGVLQCQIDRTTPWQCLSVSLTMSDW